jgi:hypothetical protein
MNFIKQNFALTQYHRYTHQDLFSMMPWERRIEIALVEKDVEERNQEAQKLAEKQNAEYNRMMSKLSKL